MTEGNGGKSSVVQGPVTVAIHNLEGELLRLREGEITNDEFRPSRTLMVVYGQRQPEEYMQRVRIPNGGLTSEQLRRLARTAQEYGNGVGHIAAPENGSQPLWSRWGWRSFANSSWNSPTCRPRRRCLELHRLGLHPNVHHGTGRGGVRGIGRGLPLV